MVRSVTFVHVADWLNSYVVKQHPDKESLRQAWMATDDPMAARAGWSLTAERVVKSPEGLDLPALSGSHRVRNGERLGSIRSFVFRAGLFSSFGSDFAKAR